MIWVYFQVPLNVDKSHIVSFNVFIKFSKTLILKLYILFQVQFSFKLGWTYNRGPGCTTEKVGQLVTNMNNSYWQCTSGCNSSLNIANVNYIYALEQVSQKIGNKEREPLHTSFQESVHTPSSMYILSNCLIDRVYKYGKTIDEII